MCALCRLQAIGLGASVANDGRDRQSDVDRLAAHPRFVLVLAHDLVGAAANHVRHVLLVARGKSRHLPNEVHKASQHARRSS